MFRVRIAASLVPLLSLVTSVGALHAQPLGVQQVLQPAVTGGHYGAAVDIDGDRAVVGARLENSTGAAYVYLRVAGAWTLQQRLVASDAQADGRYGGAVAVSGNTVFVGAPSGFGLSGNPRRGFVYVYLWNGSTWAEQARLTASDGATLDSFGASLSAEGDTLVVGSPADSGQGGKAYVFTRSGTVWTETRLIPPAVEANERYGHGVGLSGNTLCVGAPFRTEGGVRGVVSVFVRNAAQWTLQQQIIPGSGSGSAGGWSCALDGDTLAIGDTFDHSSLPVGVVYIYARSSTTWLLQQRLDPSDADTRLFGASVALRNNTAMVGAPGTLSGATTRVGQVYVYGRTGTAWSERQKIQPPNPAVRPEFGTAVAMDGLSSVVITGGRATGSFGSATVLAPGATSGPPSAPTNLQASANGNALSMSWGAPTSGAAPTSYTLMARATAGGAVLGTLPLGNVTAFAAAAPNGVFALSVTATNAAGTGPESNSVSVTLPSVPAPPGAPTSLTATVFGSTATFTWAAPATGGPVGNYAIIAGLTPGFAVPLGSLPLPAGSTTTTIPGIPPGTYYLRVLAQNAGGSSASSNEVAITVAAPSAPGAPTLNAPSVTGSTVGLSWTPGGGGAPTSYVLTALTAGGVVLGSAPLSGSSASFAGVPSGSYLLRLVAVNSVGPSPVSNTVTLVVP